MLWRSSHCQFPQLDDRENLPMNFGYPVAARAALLVGSLMSMNFVLAIAMTNPVINAPSSGGGGTTIIITGSSPGGESGSAIEARDAYGELSPSDVKWDGNEFRLKLTLPPHKPGGVNMVLITVEAAAPDGITSTNIAVTP